MNEYSSHQCNTAPATSTPCLSRVRGQWEQADPRDRYRTKMANNHLGFAQPFPIYMTLPAGWRGVRTDSNYSIAEYADVPIPEEVWENTLGS
jgi:hypothetical protein